MIVSKVFEKIWIMMSEKPQDLTDEIFEKNFGWR